MTKFKDYTSEKSAKMSVEAIRKMKKPCEGCGTYTKFDNLRQYGRDGIRVCPDCYEKYNE